MNAPPSPNAHASATPPADVAAMYDRYGEAVHRRARRMMRQDAAALDVVQETFLRAHRYRSSFRGGSGLSWLLTIADRVALDAIAARNKHAPVDAMQENLLEKMGEHALDPNRLGPAPWSEERLVQDDLVARLLQSADEQTRAILVHRFFDELGTEEIATRTNTSERTIRRRLTRFFASARSFLGQDDDTRSSTPVEAHHAPD